MSKKNSAQKYWEATQWLCTQPTKRNQDALLKAWKAFRNCFPSKRKAVIAYNQSPS